jgi:DNA repair protein RadC
MEKANRTDSVSVTELEYLERYLASCGIKDASGSAVKLLGRFVGLSSLYEVDFQGLKETAGEGAAVAVRLMVALNKRRITDLVTMGKAYSVEEIERFVESLLFGAPVENVYMLMFDKSGRLIHTDLIGEGTVNGSAISPRQLLDSAVRRNAKSVIMAHNHPGGMAKPSEADFYMTTHMKCAFDTVGIKLAAHYVVADGEIINVLPFISDTVSNYTDDAAEVANHIKNQF